MSKTFVIQSISQAHQSLGLAKPKHPLVSVVYAKDIKNITDFQDIKVVNQLYQITLKTTGCGEVRYGKNAYDYEEGTLLFTAPGQVTEYDGDFEVDNDENEGWMLVFHPDLIRKSPLADKMGLYSFFNYDVHEALHLSDDERQTIEALLDKIIKEYSQNLDRHSQNLIVSNIELLLDYCLRFYDRQFLTRTNLNGDAVSKFEKLLKTYYETEKAHTFGLPTVSYCGTELNLSSSYLSDLLKKETGKTAQEHIHLFVIEKAKNSLLNSEASISEIGYALGFEYPQHFSNLFKSKTGYSPRAYRSLN
ncbi:MAG: helix-turn-helix domain-containing protein [Bacteroidota bacterium]